MDKYSSNFSDLIAALRRATLSIPVDCNKPLQFRSYGITHKTEELWVTLNMLQDVEGNLFSLSKRNVLCKHREQNSNDFELVKMKRQALKKV